MKRSFASRVVVITGGAGGIGQALARRFAAGGARVVLTDLAQERLDTVRTELAADGVEVATVACDVTDAAGCNAAFAQIDADFGGIDVLINNAGAVHRSAFAETSPDVIRRVMEVNLFGSLNCTHAALPSLLARRGMIIVVSSIAGLAPLLGRAGYCASKHALHGLFESAAAELRPQGVDVLMVCPTFTRSGFEQAALGPDGKPLGKPRSKVGKLAEPADVADAVFHAAERGKRRLVLSNVGRVAALLSRLTPGLYERLMTRGLESELASSNAAPAQRS